MHHLDRIFVVALLSLVLSACDTLNRDQMLIRQGADNTAYNELRAKLRSLIANYAISNGFTDKTEESRVVNTVAYFQNNDEYFPITLGVRETESGFIIDLIHFHPGSGETKEYSQIKSQLLNILKSEYAQQMVLLEKEDHIEIEVGKTPNRVRAGL